MDDNGRVGRALIHLVLRRRGLGSGPNRPSRWCWRAGLRPTWPGLTATRYVGPPDSAEARDGFDRWVALAAAACLRAADDAARLIGRWPTATTQTMNQLVRAGIQVQITVGQRNRAFEAPELIEAFTAFERGLAGRRAIRPSPVPRAPCPSRRTEPGCPAPTESADGRFLTT